MNDLAATGRRRALWQCMSLVVVASVLPATVAHAQRTDEGFRPGAVPGRGWRMLGEASARRSVDRDEIRVQGDRAYTAIRLRVFEAPVEFLKVRIRFRNGEFREIEVRQFVERGGATRVIDLPGERRFIDRLVFWHQTPPGARNAARVQVWART